MPGGQPIGRYHCFYASNEYGSAIFYLRKGENAFWVGEWLTPSVSQRLVELIGSRIEEYK